MALSTPLQMMGAPGSPYTRKMLSVLRYRINSGEMSAAVRACATCRFRYPSLG